MSKKDPGGPAGAVKKGTSPESPTLAKKRSSAAAKRIVKLEKELAALTRRQAKLQQQIAAAGADGRRAGGKRAASARPDTGTSGPGASPVMGYCMHDKMRVAILDPQPMTLKNGRSAISGTCAICGRRVMRMGAGSAGR
jgi:uncharacterized protein DUF5679